MRVRDKDKGKGREVNSSAELDVRSLTLKSRVDLELDMSTFSVPIVLSTVMEDWSFQWTLIQDTEPPMVSIRQLTKFSGEEKLSATVLIEFTEPVFPISTHRSLHCQAPLKQLGEHYSAVQMVKDASLCGEDLTKRQLSSIIHVTGVIASELRSTGDSIHGVLLDVFPDPDRDAVIVVDVLEQSVSDYSGNVNPKSARLTMQYSPFRPLGPMARRKRLETPQRPYPSSTDSHTDWSTCHIIGALLCGCIVLSMAIALLSSITGKLLYLFEISLSPAHASTVDLQGRR